MSTATRTGNLIVMAPGDDAIEDEVFWIQAMWTGGNNAIQDKANVVFWDPTAAGQSIFFPKGFKVTGLDVTGTGSMYIYLC